MQIKSASLFSLAHLPVVEYSQPSGILTPTVLLGSPNAALNSLFSNLGVGGSFFPVFHGHLIFMGEGLVISQPV